MDTDTHEQPRAPPIDYSKLGSTPDALPDTPPDSPPAASTAPAEPAPTQSSSVTPVELVDAPAPAQAHPEPATAPTQPPASAPTPPPKDTADHDHPIVVDTAKVSTALPPGDQAPAPAAEPAPPAAASVTSDDAAPRPATEAAPVQQPADVAVVDTAAAAPAPAAAAEVHEPVAAEPAVVRAPTAQTSGSETPAVAQVDTVPPPTSKPIVPSAQSHLATHPATDTDSDHVLPLGSDVHPVHQAAALQDAPDHLVNAQVEKQKADKRQLYGEEPKGTIIPGYEDDQLWTMIRRFDVQVSHTLTPPTKLPRGEPDLRPSTLPAVPFNPDTLKSNLMRVYATAGVWGIYGARELMRLMSWAPENRRRTAVWCTAYFVCAALRMVLPAFFLLLATLAAYPPSRKFLFPPVPPPPGHPPSATDPTNQKGDESMIAGVGHPVEHRSRAEQIEEQAWEFTNLVQRFGARVVVGGKAGGRQGNAEVGRKVHVDSDAGDDDDDDELDAEEQELHDVAQSEGLGAAADKELKEKKLSDKKRARQKAKEAKIKRDATIGKAAKQLQDGLGNFADIMEVFANALHPPKPYPPYKAREKLATQVLVPIALVFAIVPAKVWTLVVSFAFGIAFFGQPLLWRGFALLQEKVPDWQDRIDLRNTLFSKVPTNAQVVLHIVRVAERHHTPFPLPPAPPTAQHMREAVQLGGFDADEMGADGYSADTGDKHSVEAGALANSSTTSGDDESSSSPGVKDKAAAHGKSKIVGAFKKVAKKAAVFRGDVHVEGSTAKQKVGNKIDRLLYHSRAKDDMTPHSFPAKFNGASGHLIVKHSPSVAESTIAFVPLKAGFSHPTFERPIADLVELKKRGVWIGRSVLGWAASINLEGMGLDLRFKDQTLRFAEKAHGGLGEGDKPHEEAVEGDTMGFSHVGRRDELFRRLLGISDARWEVL